MELKEVLENDGKFFMVKRCRSERKLAGVASLMHPCSKFDSADNQPQPQKKHASKARKGMSSHSKEFVRQGYF
jgi:hypothetical protein